MTSALIAWLSDVLDEEESGWRSQAWQEREGVAKPLFHFGQPLTDLMLADIKAKRAIVAACERVYRAKDREYGDGSHDLADEVLDGLAAAYAGRTGDPR